ncbi:MAG: single-stranded-DNA-specific exonuclease RecJ [Anaerovoracaceae bacterium]
MARWVFAQQNDEPLKGPQGVPETIVRILRDRGIIDFSDIEDFLDPFPQRTYDPFLLNDMAPAAEEILRTADAGERICIYGDYDADGVTSVSLLLCVFRKLTDRVCYFIPSRFKEGYGLTRRAVKAIADEGAALIVTVDCGSSAIDEVDYARSLGLRMIVTDHHNPCPEAIPACLFINPKRYDTTYPFPHLSGCGVAFKLAQAIQRLLEEKNDHRFTKTDLNKLLDLVAISTVADVVPLLDENRTLVKYGLEIINRRERPGLEALLNALDFSGKSVEAEHIAYLLAPNINAMGRMQSADIGAEVLCSGGKSRSELDRLARCMTESNKSRKAEQEKTGKLCREIIEQGGSGEWFPVIFAPDAHEGVAGIVAGHLKETLYRPVFIVTSGENGRIKGTGRSIPGLDLHEMITEVSDLFERFGGHAGACGFTMKRENLEPLRAAMQKAVLERLRNDPNLLEEEILITKTLDASEKTLDFAQMLRRLEPYGEKNPKPLFCSGDSRIESLHFMGRESEHVRFTLRGEDRTPLSCILFRRAGDYGDLLRRDALVDVAGELTVNEFRDNQQVQLVVKDMKRGNRQ